MSTARQRVKRIKLDKGVNDVEHNCKVASNRNKDLIDMPADPSIVVITGANAGVGYQAVKHLLISDKPYKIYLGARSSAKAQSAIEALKAETGYKGPNEVVPLIVDITSDESIAQAAKVLEAEGRVDVLINNAGINLDSWKERTGSQRQIFLDTMNTNLIGPHELTFALAPLLLKSSDPRLIFVSSNIGSIAMAHLPESEYVPNVDKPAGWENKKWTGSWEAPAYRTSKAALNILVVEWKRWLKADGVKIWTVQPGYVVTSLIGHTDDMKVKGAGDPATSGVFLRDVVEGKRDVDVGKFIEPDGVLPY